MSGVLLKSRRVDPIATNRPTHSDTHIQSSQQTSVVGPSYTTSTMNTVDRRPILESNGASQVRAAAAAASVSAGSSSTQSAKLKLNSANGLPPTYQTQQPLPLAQPNHLNPTDTGTQKNGVITTILPSKVAVVVDEIITDMSVQRVNSQGQTVYKQYKRGRYLGKGGFAKCYELQSMDSLRVYAGKIIPKASITKQSAKKKLIAEISIHRKINHPNVVKFERFFEDSQNVYILLEICRNQTLMELVKRRKRLTETETQFYMYQLTNTMMHLHSQNIIHRDLKLGNLFLNENMDIRLGDFGLAAQLEHADERKRTMCGTPNYIAPEILDNKDGHSFEVDTWAMGVIMYTMLIGQPPFETASVKTTYKKIRDNSYEFPSDVPISPAARSLISRILSASPSERPSLADMRNDPFFTQSPFPKQLPLACLTTPLQWRHSYHQSSSNENDFGQENVGMTHTSASQRPALTSRALNGQQVGLVDAKGQPIVNSTNTNPTAVSKPRTASTAAPIGVVAKVTSPPQKRLSSATPIDVHAAAVPPSIQPAASPVYAHDDEAARMGFFKDLIAPGSANPSTQSGAPKRTSSGSSDRRSGGSTSRRSTGEEKLVDAQPQQSAPLKRVSSGSIVPPSNQDVDDLANGVKALELKIVVDGPTTARSGPGENDDAPEDEEDVRRMHDEIERSFCQQPTTTTEAKTRSSTSSLPPPQLQPADLWVNKWVDYSNKYGLGYILSNGDSGVYFNDSSKAILSSNGEDFEYMERRSGENVNSQPERQSYTLSSYPSHLQKKVTLLKHFMNYLVPSSDDPSTKPTVVGPPSTRETRVYVKKWLRTKHAIFFRLSNRTVQVIFLDHTELVLSSQHNSVTYTDKNKKRETFSLDRETGDSAAAQDKPDLAKRMKYTKDILHHLLSRNQQASTEKK